MGLVGSDFYRLKKSIADGVNPTNTKSVQISHFSVHHRVKLHSDTEGLEIGEPTTNLPVGRRLESSPHIGDTLG